MGICLGGGVRAAGCGMRDAGCGMRDAGCGIWAADDQMPTTKRSNNYEETGKVTTFPYKSLPDY